MSTATLPDRNSRCRRRPWGRVARALGLVCMLTLPGCHENSHPLILSA